MRRRVPKSQPDLLHEGNLSRIRSQAARVAYIYLIRVAENLAGYDCYPTIKGVIRNFRYCAEGEQPFSFIVNAESLLFYVRKPVIARFGPALAHFRKVFAEVNQPRPTEITIRIRDLGAAKRLMREVFGVVDA